jgi:DNA mismatch repair protein MutS
MNQREPAPAVGGVSGPAGEAPGRVTPMMEQYIEIRAANPDCLLFYRMGDFYELFFDDAVTASRALGITLTKRGKHMGEDIAMCGVPIHAADDYLQKLIALGFRVAVCEQTEDPAEARRRGPKAVVQRAVTRLVTPGTLTEDRLLDGSRSNYLAALLRIPGSGGEDGHAVAWTDISTGEFRVAECAPGGLAALLARIEPREVLLPDRLAGEAGLRSLLADLGAASTPLPAAFFDAGSAEMRLCRSFGVETMEAFGAFSRAELSAGAALIAYVEKTQVAGRPPMEPPKRVSPSDSMRLDGATRANLELFRSTSGGRAGSLVAAVDRTQTSAGSRLLSERLASPSCEVGTVEARLDAVDFFLRDEALRGDIRACLRGVPDMLRCLSRLSLDRGGPRDLDAIRAGIEAAGEIARMLGGRGHGTDPALPLELFGSGGNPEELPLQLAKRLGSALADDLPILKRDGGFVRPGACPELDDARALRDESRRVIASLQSRYAEATGIRSLKIRHNNVLGYFIEVPAGQAAAITRAAPGAAEGAGEASPFIHRQTLAGAMRFTSAELGALEERIANAGDRALAIELATFDELAAAVATEEAAIRATARALAEIDVASALAELAATEGYVRPTVYAGLAFEIEGGRHPVVEQNLKRDGGSFVGNDCRLGEAPVTAAAALPEGDGAAQAGRIWLVTGPNMAGKSTFLRQNALIAILAQAGSFVPAKRARIGIVDAVFSRVGAADDLARGRSTFMVEMVETAAILNQAGPRALVILDEIGRGTATFDGLSIAWAAIEHLHGVNRSRALFATHYHELTALAAKLPRLQNVTTKVKEWKGDVVFLHEIVPGSADRSYGIQVAKLAGLPAPVIARAREVLKSLERSDRSRPPALIDDLPLFAVGTARGTSAEPAEPHPALVALEAIDPDELSPKEALERLYELKRLARAKGEGAG